MAVNNKNEIVVTDFHNHSVKVSGRPPSVRASPALPLPRDSSLPHLLPLELVPESRKPLPRGCHARHGAEAGDTALNTAHTSPLFLGLTGRGRTWEVTGGRGRSCAGDLGRGVPSRSP